MDPASERRRASITAMRSEADRMLEVAQHDSVRELIRLAIRDLDEADRLLGRAQAPSERVWAHAMMDLQIDFARWRLDTAKAALEKGGPAAKLFDL
jgi:hypothetical protein